MSKSAKKHRKHPAAKTPSKKSFTLSFGRQDALFIGIIFLFLLMLLKPLAIDHLSPQGVDVIGGIGKTHQISEYAKKTGERALWNPYIFSGMPVYHRISARAFSVDNLLAWLSRLFHIVFIYYFFGAIGFYILLRYLKMTPLLSFFGALLFILMPHYKSLYLVGHLAKFKALMLLPWIFLTFRYFLDRRTLLSAALFALAFGTQIRSEHYQIVFYSGLMVFALGVYPFIKDILEKKYSRFAKSFGLLAAALILAIAMSAQPLFLAKEYLPYSKRGKTTIDVNKPKQAAKENSGVSIKYATQWSTAPSEIFTWFLPRFYGGMSQENYDGSRYAQLKGRPIPAYWGNMPFTQSYEYMGALMLFLALLGMIAYRKKSEMVSLMLFAVFLILLSFGRHFQSFYSLFYYYVPFFNKFRAPMMSVTVTYFVFVLFAAYGLQALSKMKTEEIRWQDHKQVVYLMAGFFALGIIFWFLGMNASFTKAGDPYKGQTLEIVRNIRAEYFNKDLLRYFIIILLASAALFGYLKRKINFTVLVFILGLIAVGDLLQVQGRVRKPFTNIKHLERQYFAQNNTDRFLESDHSIYRILPIGKMFSDNRWAYYHQTIGGYTPIKMYTIEELVEKNIYNGWDKKLPLNWNVLKILDVKYVIASQKINSPFLTPVYADPSGKLFTYRFNQALPRAYFVGKYRVITDEYQRIRIINSKAFDPDKEAVLERAPKQKIQTPDSSFTKLTSFTPNKITYHVYTDKQALLVLSEVWYPPGWKIFIDGNRVRNIYKTDHAVQSVVVPAGAHKIEMRFEPDSYFKDIKIASFSVGILYLIILWGLVGMFKNKRLKV